MFQLFNVHLAAGKVRRETLEGRDHLVVPAAMLAEGAWTGEYGTFLYPAAELKKSQALWDHKPVVVYHPKKNGQAVSACDPAVLNTQKVGVILNTRFDEKAKKLRAEVWIDEARCNEIDPRVIDAINKKQLTEVSTGLTMMSDETEGEWVHNSGGKEKKRKYQGTASDYQPDHLAILPDQLGAFQVADGGGLLQVNSTGEVIGGIQTVVEAARTAATRGPKALKKYLRGVFAANALSFSDIRQKLYELLAAKYGEKGKSWYGDIIDIFPDYCVFCSYDRRDAMYRQDYTTTGDVVALSGEAVQVQRATEYVAVNAAGERHQESSVEKKVMIDALIANSDGVYTEADRADLDKWEDGRLKKVHAKFEKKVDQQNAQKMDPPKPEPKEETKIVLAKAEYDELVKAKEVVQQNTVPSLEDSLKGLHPKIAGQLRKAFDREEAERKFLINKLVEKSPKLNPKLLETYELEDLEGLAHGFGVTVQQQNGTGRQPLFIGNAGGGAGDTDPDPETGFEDHVTDWKAVSQRNNAGGRRLGRTYEDFTDADDDE